ncbi:MAG TPA: hypothetical protein VEK55_13275 [Xanthobacteraceae bacterium]|nr:hypothetical protein [Xanthobacteraceae bacterium]
MAIALRLIRIKQVNTNTVTFQPDGGTDGQPLGVNTGDNINWNNMTNSPLQLQVLSITKAGVPQPLTQLFQGISLLPGSGSNPTFNVDKSISGTVITYCCIKPTQQQHQIVVDPPAPRPKGGGARPKGGGPRPKSGGARPKGGGPRPKGGGPRPKSGGARPKGGGPRPKVGGPRPKGGGPRPK